MSGRVVAVVPARFGSKRLPGKNALPLGGRPLLAYSVMLARYLPFVDCTVITSDSDEFLTLGCDWGAHAGIKRPDELASDTASTLDTLRHTLDFFPSAEWVLLLQPNCPLRNLGDLSDVWTNISHMGIRPNAVVSVDVGAYKLGRISPDNYTFRPEYRVGARKQDMPTKARENGVFYFLRADHIRKGSLFGTSGTRIYGHPTPVWESQANIDTPHDWDLTRFLFTHYHYDRMFQDIQSALLERRAICGQFTKTT